MTNLIGWYFNNVDHIKMDTTIGIPYLENKFNEDYLNYLKKILNDTTLSERPSVFIKNPTSGFFQKRYDCLKDSAEEYSANEKVFMELAENKLAFPTWSLFNNKKKAIATIGFLIEGIYVPIEGAGPEYMTNINTTKRLLVIHSNSRKIDALGSLEREVIAPKTNLAFLGGTYVCDLNPEITFDSNDQIFKDLSIYKK